MSARGAEHCWRIYNGKGGLKMISVNKAIETLKDNQIEFETIYGISEFHYTMLTFDTKLIAMKAATLLEAEIMSLGNNGKWGIKYFN